jgi:hypothetical protein
MGAYLVGVEMVGVGEQESRDLCKKIGGEGGPAAGHREKQV